MNMKPKTVQTRKAAMMPAMVRQASMKGGEGKRRRYRSKMETLTRNRAMLYKGTEIQNGWFSRGEPRSPMLSVFLYLSCRVVYGGEGGARCDEGMTYQVYALLLYSSQVPRVVSEATLDFWAVVSNAASSSPLPAPLFSLTPGTYINMGVGERVMNLRTHRHRPRSYARWRKPISNG
jgi:hypothetical protein